MSALLLVISAATSSVAIVALQCRLTGSLAPISVSARCHATGKRTPGVRMEEHEGKRVHAARWQQYAAGAFVPPASFGRARDGPSPEESVLPPALRAWVERSFEQCTEVAEHLIVEREFLQRVAQGGLDEVDWDAEPLIDMRAASPSSADPPPAAVPTHTDGGRAEVAAGQGMLTDEMLAARPQPRMSHREQMARLAEAAHAAEVEALAARGLGARAGPRAASGLRALPSTAHGGLPGGRRPAPAAAPASVTSSGHRIRIRDRREPSAAA